MKNKAFQCVPKKLYRRQLIINGGLIILNLMTLVKIERLDTKVDLLYQKVK